RSGLVVSEICLGAMTFGGDGFWKVIGGQDQQEVSNLIKGAFDKGVTFIDTADVYSNGLSEQLLGGAIRELGLPRDELVIATKVFGRYGAYTQAGTAEEARRSKNANLWGLSRKHILDGIDASLERLGLDYVDLYQTHAFDPLTPIEETLEALDEVVRSGRARYIGLCNNAAWQIAKALGISDANGLSRFQSAQMYYSIAGRDLEREVVPLCKEEGLSILPWSPLAGGFLSGKYTRSSAPEAGSRRVAFDFPPVDKEKAYDIIDVMAEIGKAKSASVAQVALAWLLHQPQVTSVIIGAKTQAQLDDNIAATEVKLTADELAKLNGVSALKPEYPGWMLDRQGADRRGAVS
ncbi:MAG TPA: aldo/keto reductase, partial [Caulobacterales bacterium]|nr:aldo/keto reductase [Caulobacterales bacterium]